MTLRMGIIAFKIKIIYYVRKSIVDTDVVKDVKRLRQRVITRVLIQYFMTRRYPLTDSNVTR